MFCMFIMLCCSTPLIYTFPYSTLFRSPADCAISCAFLPATSLDFSNLAASSTFSFTSANSAGCGPRLSASTGIANPFGTLVLDRKSTRLNSSHVSISYAVFCLKKNNIDVLYVHHALLLDSSHLHFSLLDALPISGRLRNLLCFLAGNVFGFFQFGSQLDLFFYIGELSRVRTSFVSEHRNSESIRNTGFRSEEHTSELQSRFDLVCRLLLEKKQH